MSAQAAAQHPEEKTQGLPRIILASAAGTMIEWYDFYIFGSLASVIAGKFYHTGTPLGDIIAWLAAFAVGFIVRPFGAIVFGRVGDIVGRKYTFLVTMTLMGLCTFCVGLLPTQDAIGPAAGIILILLRIIQGLALGGEYGGAATYVAEHSPDGRRGFYTSWIQITATLGLFLSLGVILITRSLGGEDWFAGKGAYATQWWQGWRVPFLISILLVAISLWIRFSLRESPMYAKLKQKGATSKNPLRESFGNKLNLSYVLIALFVRSMNLAAIDKAHPRTGFHFDRHTGPPKAASSAAGSDLGGDWFAPPKARPSRPRDAARAIRADTPALIGVHQLLSVFIGGKSFPYHRPSRGLATPRPPLFSTWV